MNRTILFVLLTGLAIPAHGAPALQTRPLNEVAVHPERSASAQAVSLNESRLSAEIAARVERIPVESGQTVAKGAALVRLECSDYLLASERAAANLKAGEARARVAESQLERSRKLAEQKFISPAGLDMQFAQTESARAEAAVARSALNTAHNAARKCDIRAPFPAVVLERIAQVGEMAAPGTPLITVRDLSRIEVRADIQEKDRSLTEAGRITFVAPQGSYPVQMIRLSPALSRSTRLLEARLKFTGQTATSGSSGRIVWQSPLPHLPTELVTRRNGRLGTFVLEQGKPRFLELPQAEEGRPVAVPDLPAGTQIVTRGQEAL
ncbi:MAG: efflux RND transporter periplasmic adaptor subunit [Nitrosomonadales bacterium]|nr:efflux RND transporter periplasmic adaptor subunit [Nitrosomonadales bacterium]